MVINCKLSAVCLIAVSLSWTQKGCLLLLYSRWPLRLPCNQKWLTQLLAVVRQPKKIKKFSAITQQPAVFSGCTEMQFYSSMTKAVYTVVVLVQICFWGCNYKLCSFLLTANAASKITVCTHPYAWLCLSIFAVCCRSVIWGFFGGVVAAFWSCFAQVGF